MRSLPLAAIAGLLCCLAPASLSAQKLSCYPCSHPFGQVQVGNSSTFSFKLTNTGKVALKISSKSISGSAFTLGSFTLPVKILPGASVHLTVKFTPIIKGYIDATITLGSNDPKSPLKMHVAGTGVSTTGPQLGVSPATLNFGSVTMGSSASLQATLTASHSAVTVSSAQSTSSEFVIRGLTLPLTIQAGKSVTFTVKFTPNASGAASGQAGFVSNAINSPTVEQLTGTGVAQGSHTVSLTWDPGDNKAAGYNVYRGTASSGPYQMINPTLDPSTNYTDNTVVSGKTYYYVTTEVNTKNQESGYSNVAKAVIPSP